MTAAAKAKPERSFEDIFGALTQWLRAPSKSREQRTETISIGLIVKLYEAGTLQATGRGRDADTAFEDALEQVGAL
jgi:hypothetical protein